MSRNPYAVPVKCNALIAQPDRRGEFSAAAVTLFGNPARKTPSIAVPVGNIFS